MSLGEPKSGCNCQCKSPSISSFEPPRFPLIVTIKKLREDAHIPQYATDGDAGMDFVAVTKKITPNYIEYGTGLAIEIPQGYFGLITPRSSITKYPLGVMLKNGVGIIDSGYRGEITFRIEHPAFPCVYDEEHFYEEPHMCWTDTDGLVYEHEPLHIIPTPNVGDRIGQIIILPYPQVTFIEGELSNSQRGEGGYGSTGV